MFSAPNGRSTAGDCLRPRRPRQTSQQAPALFWIVAVTLAALLACVQTVAAGRNREHGQRGNGGTDGGGYNSMSSGGGNSNGVRSRTDRLRHHQPEKFALTIAKEEQHSEFMKGKSELGAFHPECIVKMTCMCLVAILSVAASKYGNDDPSLNTVKCTIICTVRASGVFVFLHFL